MTTAKRIFHLLGFILAAGASAQPELPLIEPAHGMIINKTCRIKPGEYLLNDKNDSDPPAITITGMDVTVDFEGVTLRGVPEGQAPDSCYGTAIYVLGRNITIKNLKAHGYTTVIVANGVDNLSILDCDFSYNRRQRLHSMREREDLSDWLSYHNNENDEWRTRHPSAVYLKNCNYALVRGLRIAGGQNGLMLSGCNDGLFYNNTIHFNSGIGIGLYRSSRNRILHNRLDWNVRGYSHGFYSRGQDSAGILCYEQSNDNVFAYNSATHSGDGFFLWAGQHTMDTGEGGCNRNAIFANDFSHSPTNGIEVTFSSNKIIGNRLEDCTYGIWGGYSWNTYIARNRIAGNRFGIAIEHGQSNSIEYNYFSENQTGIRIWQRESQPSDWGYAQKRDTRSRDYAIRANVFRGDSVPLRIDGSERVAVNDRNIFWGFKELLVTEKPNTDFYFVKNTVHQSRGWAAAAGLKKLNHQAGAPSERELRSWAQLSDEKSVAGSFRIPRWPAPWLPPAMDAMLPASHPRGRQWMLIGEWGPYDFQRPVVWLRDIRDSLYVFGIYGPEGEWRLGNAEGLAPTGDVNGKLPDTLIARRLPGYEDLKLELEFRGAEVVTEWGQVIPAGTPVSFHYRRFEKPLSWRVRFFHYEGEELPTAEYEAWARQNPLLDTMWNELAGRWWGNPAPGVNADRFVTLAETEVDVKPGNYILTLTADDGVRLWVDDKLLIDNWSIHEAAVEEVQVALQGRHRIRIAHFDAGGIATLDFRMRAQ